MNPAKPDRTLARRLHRPGRLLLVLGLLLGCAAPAPLSTQDPDLTQHPLLARPPAETVTASASQARRAALVALANLNCTMSVEGGHYLKGQFRVGEIIEVILQPAKPGECQVWVDTHRTYVGGAWQKDRTQDFLREFRKAMHLNVEPAS